MASQNQRTAEGVVLTEQPEAHGQTEDGALAPVHQPPTHKEPGIRDIDTHLQQRMRRSHIPAMTHFKTDKEAHEDMQTITEVQVKEDVNSDVSSREAHGDRKTILNSHGARVGCHKVMGFGVNGGTCECGGTMQTPRICSQEF